MGSLFKTKHNLKTIWLHNVRKVRYCWLRFLCVLSNAYCCFNEAILTFLPDGNVYYSFDKVQDF